MHPSLILAMRRPRSEQAWISHHAKTLATVIDAQALDYALAIMGLLGYWGYAFRGGGCE